MPVKPVRHGAGWTGWITRYIDDLFIAGDVWPSQQEYGMEYKFTSTDPNNLLYIGLRLYKDEKGAAHSTLYDRALEYPIQIKRYPRGGTVAPRGPLCNMPAGLQSYGRLQGQRSWSNVACPPSQLPEALDAQHLGALSPTILECYGPLG